MKLEKIRRIKEKMMNEKICYNVVAMKENVIFITYR